MAKFVVIIGFLVSFAAGLVVGSRRAMVSESPASPSAPAPATQSSHQNGETRRSGGRSGYLTAQLGLTPEQQKQLDQIWSAVAKSNDQEERRRAYRRERDEAIADLVPAARLEQYDQIINTYHGRIEALESRSREAYRAAVEQTKSILTTDQRTRYEELIKRHGWGPRDRDRGSTTSSTNSRNTTRPSSEHRATSHAGGEQTNESHDPLKGATR